MRRKEKGIICIQVSLFLIVRIEEASPVPPLEDGLQLPQRKSVIYSLLALISVLPSPLT